MNCFRALQAKVRNKKRIDHNLSKEIQTIQITRLSTNSI